jgi:transcriptional regulator with XRE-family HTH domain
MLNYRFIEQKMKEKRVTYRKMSELLGFKSPGTCWKWVHGRTQMKAIYLERLTQIFGVTVQSFFMHDDNSRAPYGGGDCDEI